MTNYASVDLKLSRAREHMETFKAELTTYVGSDPMYLLPQPHDDPLRKPFNIGLREPPPPRLSVLYGDFVHNLRSTLDHLVMALAIDNGADPFDSTIQFPICDQPDRFFGVLDKKTGKWPRKPIRGTGRYQIRALRSAPQAFIEGLQPYRRPSDAWILEEIQNLDNIDKHRNIIDTNIEASALFGHPDVSIEWATRLRLEHDTYLATVVYPPGYSGVEVKPMFSAGICVERRNRIGFLDAIAFGEVNALPHVREIVKEAKAQFP